MVTLVINPGIPEIPEELERSIDININELNTWENGEYIYYQYNFELKNIGNLVINLWKFEITSFKEVIVDQVWNANCKELNLLEIEFKNTDYNGIINVDQTVSVGIVLKSKYKNNYLKVRTVELK